MDGEEVTNFSPEELDAIEGAANNIQIDVAKCVNYLKGNEGERNESDDEVAYETIIFGIQYLAAFTMKLAGVPGIDTTVAFEEFEAATALIEAERIIKEFNQ